MRASFASMGRVGYSGPMHTHGDKLFIGNTTSRLLAGALALGLLLRPAR